MELIRGLQNHRVGRQGCVLTIGNFDGIHLGHQAVLERLGHRGRQLDLPALLVTFEPQAREFFSPSAAPARLTGLREKIVALSGLPLTGVCCLRFDRCLAALSASAFAVQLLHRGLGARHVMVGDDFRFGHHREGDVDMLKDLGRRHGFSVGQMATRHLRGARVSSTRVRQALHGGDLDTAKALLGRAYSLCGRVLHGDRRGRTLGFPTANVDLRRRALPVTGVFAVSVHGLSGEGLPGVANIGVRPTVDGRRALMEVHLLDFDQDIYSRRVQVSLARKIRDERRFDSLAALKARIREDVMDARAWFGL